MLIFSYVFINNDAYHYGNGSDILGVENLLYYPTILINYGM